MSTTAVLIVEDDPHFRQSLVQAVRSAGDLVLAGAAADLPDGQRLMREARPDVALIDIGLPSGTGIALIHQASAQVPRCESLVLTVFTDDRAVLACIEAGATGYLVKDARGVDIVEQIRLLRDGGSPISPGIARRLLVRLGGHGSTAAAPAPLAAALSVQEHTVLSYSAKGYSFEEIARLMGLSRHTVETYVKRVYRKLQVHSKTEAVYEARQQGLMRD